MILDAKLLKITLTLLSRDEAKKLLEEVAISKSTNSRQLENHFESKGRSVAEQLARERSIKTGSSIYDLNHQVNQHLETIKFIYEHLPQLPENLKTEFAKVAKSALAEFDAIKIYESIQNQHLILGLLPKRLIDKIININRIEKNVEKTSSLLQKFFIMVVDEIAKHKKTTVSSKPKERPSSRPISSSSLKAVETIISDRSKGFSGTAFQVVSFVTTAIRNESGESNPDLVAFQENLALGLSQLKSNANPLGKADVKKISKLLHPDRFEPNDEIQSIVNAALAIFNRIMAT
jgi:hypothetical protein